ncbi:hypothetical protein K6Y31_19630 [Motilimonas cestriensis]|uniref:Tox-HNH-HHH domain-containing protein n=1 Tax=Motilimonas cestriensis TaxID=2742685 RepID=A0ABS8WGU6_9GAMM|nr:hypothetical protein [Motilimonas cestriensis]MCE2596991.1 hypothetical protein [Motilimonas cestriensis]
MIFINPLSISISFKFSVNNELTVDLLVANQHTRFGNCCGGLVFEAGNAVGIFRWVSQLLFPRNGKAFWGEWLKMNPDSLSHTNKALIEGLNPRTGERLYRTNKKGIKVYYDHIAPRVDNTWIKHFPEHKDFKFQRIEHHHVDEGRWAIPLPWDLHRGKGNYNIWHNFND